MWATKQSPILNNQNVARNEEIAALPFDMLRVARDDTRNIQNKSPSAIALGDWFPDLLFLTGKASPNSRMAIVIVIIIVGEVNLLMHKFAYYSTNLQINWFSQIFTANPGEPIN